jgi:hypothetical protein
LICISLRFAKVPSTQTVANEGGTSIQTIRLPSFGQVMHMHKMCCGLAAAGFLSFEHLWLDNQVYALRYTYIHAQSPGRCRRYRSRHSRLFHRRPRRFHRRPRSRRSHWPPSPPEAGRALACAIDADHDDGPEREHREADLQRVSEGVPRGPRAGAHRSYVCTTRATRRARRPRSGAWRARERRRSCASR